MIFSISRFLIIYSLVLSASCLADTSGDHAKTNVKKQIQNILEECKKKLPYVIPTNLPERVSIGKSIYDLEPLAERICDPHFVESLQNELNQGLPSWFRNWKGCMLLSGHIWFNWEGKEVIALNFYSQREAKLGEMVKEELDRLMDPSALPLGENSISCQTDKHYIRVDNINGDFRYLSWDLKDGITSLALRKPSLKLNSGTFDSEGSAGNFTVHFKNGNYSYELDHTYIGKRIGTELIVKHGKKIISQVFCNPAKLSLTAKDIQIL